MVNPRVKAFVEEALDLHQSAMEIGEIIRHPDGRQVKVIDGQMWGVSGISNFWYWQEVLEGGGLGPVEHGYGWTKGSAAEAEPAEDEPSPGFAP